MIFYLNLSNSLASTSNFPVLLRVLTSHVLVIKFVLAVFRTPVAYLSLTLARCLSIERAAVGNLNPDQTGMRLELSRAELVRRSVRSL